MIDWKNTRLSDMQRRRWGIFALCMIVVVVGAQVYNVVQYGTVNLLNVAGLAWWSVIAWRNLRRTRRVPRVD